MAVGPRGCGCRAAHAYRSGAVREDVVSALTGGAHRTPRKGQRASVVIEHGCVQTIEAAVVGRGSSTARCNGRRCQGQGGRCAGHADCTLICRGCCVGVARF